MKRIYLDNNATTALDPRVLEAMLLDLRGGPANPSSVHFFGQKARAHLTEARGQIADFLQVKPHELVFTSGGTESLNMVLRGLFDKQAQGHIITTDIEHQCVYNTIKVLESRGCSVSYLKTGLYGAAKPEEVQAALRPDTRLIALTAVNGETGVKTDLNAIAKIAEGAGIPFVVDGVALLGKELFTIPAGVSAMGFSGHKLHAPKGIGLAFIRSQLKIPPLMTGGDQEGGKRPGTENMAGILGLAKAVTLLRDVLPGATKQMQTLRDHLEHSLKTRLGNVSINGEGERICNTSNLCFSGIDGETLLMHLDLSGIAVSHGSACASGALEPSRVLLNMGLAKEKARSSLRFSLSRETTREEIDQCIETICKLVH
jgi:cysteine desulfurase